MPGRVNQQGHMDRSRWLLVTLPVSTYEEVWSLQKKIVDAKVEGILLENVVLTVEHEPVFTLGRRGNRAHLHVSQAFLEQKGIPLIQVERGGDVTYHGPGQIVGYPIFNLEAFSLGVKQYIFNIEEAIILTLAAYNIQAGRLNGAIGVWLNPDDPAKARKICAIGVKASRYVSMHGFAFNVNTELSYYHSINPCGFVDKGVTSMQKELGKEVELKEVKEKLLKSLEKVFNFQLEDI